MTENDINMPRAPEIYRENDQVAWPVCPNCRRKIMYRYDGKTDRWYYEEACGYCGQKILDIQKQNY